MGFGRDTSAAAVWRAFFRIMSAHAVVNWFWKAVFCVLFF